MVYLVELITATLKSPLLVVLPATRLTHLLVWVTQIGRSSEKPHGFNLQMLA